MRYVNPRSVPGFRASGRERLEQLANFLDTVAPGRLTFSRWYGDGRGCAVGLAAANEPWFQAQGLSLRRNDDLKECQPVYRDRRDWRAVVAFFEISQAEARSLFAPDAYDGELRPSPRLVAARIRAFLASPVAQASHLDAA
jgi:hypothetical protein